MDESNVWGPPRFITFLAVLAVHLALLALLLTSSQTRIPFASASNSVEVMFLPPTRVPKVRFQSARLQRWSTDTAISITLPGLDSPSMSPPSSGTDGDAPAVNWTAEAHRAVQAVEIRRNHPPRAISNASPWTDWWPQGKHYAGDQYKTESGDWIVWISSYCYQIAKWGPGTYGSTPSQTVCPRQLNPSRGDAQLSGEPHQ